MSTKKPKSPGVGKLGPVRGPRIPVMVPQLIVAGKRDLEIAEVCGVAPATISRWRSNPGVVKAVERLIQQSDREFLDQRAMIRRLVTDSIVELLLDTADPPDPRLEAAKAKARDQAIKLYGLDAPTRRELGGVAGQPIAVEGRFTMADFDAALARLTSEG